MLGSKAGTAVISVCWGKYRDLDAEGYTHRTYNHIISFDDKRTGGHKHYREHIAPCEGFSESLQGDGGLHTSPSSLYVRGEVQGRESGPIHKVPSPHRHILLERIFNAFRIVDRLPPAFTASPTTGKSACTQHAALHIFTFDSFDKDLWVTFIPRARM